MTNLFTPISIGKVEIPNRVWMSPMCQYSCEGQDGVPTEWHLVHLGTRASGGAGLIMAEATAVTPEGRITPWCTGIWNDEQTAAWKEVVDFIESQGSVPALQLAHAGRKGSSQRPWLGSGTVEIENGGWETVSPSDIAFDGYKAPRALETEEVYALIEDFLTAAKRAVSAGFKLIEIHAAHGYLIHQFLSPLSNKRDDEFGGDLENRSRFLVEILKAIRGEFPDLPILIRFSATDYAKGGWDLEQTIEVACRCRELGADLFDISSGGLVGGVKIPIGPSYQAHFAEELKTSMGESDIVSAVGQITEIQQANELVSSGKVDAVMLGRQLLRDPYWPLRAAHELGIEINWPNQYLRGKFPKYAG